MDDKPQVLARLTYDDDAGPAIHVRWAHVEGRPTAFVRVGSSEEAAISDQLWLCELAAAFMTVAREAGVDEASIRTVSKRPPIVDGVS